MSFWGTVGRVGLGVGTGGLSEAYRLSNNDAGNNARMDQARGNLNQQAGLAGQFANQGQAGYGNMTGQLGGTYGQLNDAMGYLRGQMQGQNSVSAEQLRQGLQQNLAAQQSMAASASPQNSAMAARTAAMQMGRVGSGMAGQQALAGIQERNAAAAQYGQLGSALGQLQLGQRGQDVNVGLGGRNSALQGYGSVLGGPQNSTQLQRLQPLLQAGGAALAAG